MDVLGISSTKTTLLPNMVFFVSLKSVRLEMGCTSFSRIRNIFLKVRWNCGFMTPYMKGFVRLLQNTK